LALLDDPAECRFEDLGAVAIADAGQRRVVRYFVLERQVAESAVGQVIANLFAELPFRGDTEKVRHQLHPEVDFRVNRWPSLLDRVPGSRQFSNERQIEYPVNAT